MFSFKKRKAVKLHDEAKRLYETDGNEADAISLYFQALELDEARATTHYNLGLIYKYQHEWEKSLKHNKRSYELNPNDEASIWNWGIAATALENWEEARVAWKKYGIDIEDGEGEITTGFGVTPVRIYNDDGEAEVVWGQRLDPARIQIENIPLPKSGYRYQDIVLNDGAPNGVRISEGNEYPVFDMLALFSRSEFRTFTIKLRLSMADDMGIVTKEAEKKDVKIEDWTTDMQDICSECSEGSVNHDETKVLDAVQVLERRIGLAVMDEGKAEDFMSCFDAYKNIEILSFEKSL